MPVDESLAAASPAPISSDGTFNTYVLSVGNYRLVLTGLLPEMYLAEAKLGDFGQLGLLQELGSGRCV